MDDEDEIKFELTNHDGGKHITIEVTSTAKMTPKEFILALEHFLTDLIRAENQRDDNPSLH